MSAVSRKSRMATSVARVMYTNAVYFPSSRIYQGDSPGMLNYGCINHVYYAYASVTADGSVFVSPDECPEATIAKVASFRALLGDEWADARAPVDGVQGGLGSLMHLKQRHPHLQVVLSIGGSTASEVFPIVASSTLLRDNFARSALGLVEASGLDGIDIAWEFPSEAKHGHDFLALLAAVRIHLPDDRFILTAVLPAAKEVLDLIDLKTAAEYLDYINLVAYDFFGTWTSKSGHHAQLYTMNKDEPSASSGSILLGIPTYGRSFLKANGPGQDFNGVGGQDGTFEYSELPRKGCKEIVDRRYIAAQCVGGDGGFVTYDNPETVKVKAEFCKQKGLGGLFYWNGPADSRDQARSLIAAGFRALHTS
ncbi:hypothetical protein TrVFT333_003623 [Trichoderma virens FT-333]|nr:hypothetical protein TrVFT333_003623 [Trichoderma virens FT-333]